MRKNICFIITIILVLCMTGCSTNNDTEKMSNSILKMFKDYNYVDKSLSKNDTKLIDSFKEKELKENKVIELNNYFNEYSLTENADSDNVYTNNHKYYIKYSDIKWNYTTSTSDADGAATALIYANGYEVFLSIEDFPIFYTDTKDNSKYNYSYVGTISTTTETDMYYKSFYDSTGLIIKYTKVNNQINNIELVYEPYTSYVEEEKKTTSNFAKGVEIATFIAGFILLTYLLLNKIKKNRSF